MKTVGQQMVVFGDYYYNSSREEIGDLAKSLKKYPISDIASYLKVVMQDILAHLAGSTSFMDACMVRDKLHFECRINNKIGKKKLVEFLALLEELDNLGIHLDEVAFLKNENDDFLHSLTDYRIKGILQEYLSINKLDDFLEMVIMISVFMPMAKRAEDFDKSIPDPTDFDFKNKYYRSIDYLPLYRDSDRHESLMLKHTDDGREINLFEWIDNYRHRYDLTDGKVSESILKVNEDNDNVFHDENIEKDIIDFARDEDYGFSEDEIENLRVKILEKEKDILRFMKQVLDMRASILMILDSQDVKLSDEEIKALEKEFVMETVVKRLTNKSRKKKKTNYLVFAAILATLVLLPNLKHDNDNILNKKECVRIEQEKDTDALDEKVLDEDLKQEENISIKLPEESITEEEYGDNEASDLDDEDNIYETEFVLGERVKGNVPFYESSTSDTILGFLNEDVIIIGFFATLDGKDGMSLLRSCRTQEHMEKFLRLYHGDGKDIIWRAAVTRIDDERVLEYLRNGEEIPYEFTTCYIDCIPVREMKKIRGR